MSRRIINFGVIGCGLMGREFASAAARWCHLLDLDFAPRIVAACDTNPVALGWFQRNLPELKMTTSDYHELLALEEIEAVYIALPHNQHQQVYIDAIQAGKHLLGEKPFGIDQASNQAILGAAARNSQVLVRCSSEFPFFPGAYRIAQWMRENRFGRIIEVDAGFWHSSDLDPNKPINWKRQIATNGEYGCMGDLGMHVLHLPLRFGWKPDNLRALLSKIIEVRPDKDGKIVVCETWDNAILACETITGEQNFPMLLSFKRIAPGHADTWFLRIQGTALSAEFTTQNPKQLRFLPYSPGGPQEWHVMDLPYSSAYPCITGSIFEFGFSDSILQMWAAFCDEIVHPNGMQQPFRCALPEETAISHQLFTAALESQHTGNTIMIRS
jgi:predicted dehydrogenase